VVGSVGTWTPLTNAAPDAIGTMVLLSDGTVMAQGSGAIGVSNTWYRLTPNATGSYIDGTWSARARMGTARLYYGSNVLQDGRLFLVGGEYSGPQGAQNFVNTGEIYDPVTNTWSRIANFPQPVFGDDPTEILPDGRILAGYIFDGRTWIYDPTANTWAQTGT